MEPPITNDTVLTFTPIINNDNSEEKKGCIWYQRELDSNLTSTTHLTWNDRTSHLPSKGSVLNLKTEDDAAFCIEIM